MADSQRLPANPVVGASKPRLWKVLGPGLVTGAADDDPSGIATYSQAGTQFGFQLGWTLLLTYPLMVAIQAISARVGRTTGKGIAGVVRAHYPNWLLLGIVALLFTANTLNIGADLGAMAETGRLPVDNPSTHLELTMIHEAMILEYSGPYLGLIEWGASIKQLLLMTLLINSFLPFGLHAEWSLGGLLISLVYLLLKLLVLAASIVLVETTNAKMRFFRVPDLLAMAFTLAALGLVSTFLF